MMQAALSGELPNKVKQHPDSERVMHFSKVALAASSLLNHLLSRVRTGGDQG